MTAPGKPQAKLAVLDGGAGTPPEPQWSDTFSDVLDQATAHQIWGITIREMQAAGTLATANAHAIERLVHFRVQYDRAARTVAEEGPVLKAPRTGVPLYSPYWVVMIQADKALKVLEQELGLAPIRRGRAAKASHGKRAPRPADKFIPSNS